MLAMHFFQTASSRDCYGVTS